MAFTSEVKTLPAAIITNASTEEEWKALTKPIPANMITFASDTKVIKIGDGATLWSNLPVFYKEGLIEETVAGAVAGATHRIYVDDIAGRDLLNDEQKKAFVIVKDASADETVESGYAVYVWNETDSDWMKLSEGESLDIDLTKYFHLDNNSADDIKDGSTKVMMTTDERTALADAVQYSHKVVIRGVNATELDAMLQAD